MTLKIQELQIDGETYRLREPRLKDYLAARKSNADEFIFEMLANMLLGPDGEAVGRQAVDELPLRVFDVLSEAVNELSVPKRVPLDRPNGLSTDLLSQSEEQPSLNLGND